MNIRREEDLGEVIGLVDLPDTSVHEGSFFVAVILEGILESSVFVVAATFRRRSTSTGHGRVRHDNDRKGSGESGHTHRGVSGFYIPDR